MTVEDMARAHAEKPAAPEDLRKVAELVDRLLDAQLALADAQELAKERAEAVRRLEEDSIPAALDEVGFAEVKLGDGRKVLVEEKLFMSIPKSRKEEACRWLEEHELGALVRADVVVPLERGEEEKFSAVREALQGSGIPFQRRPEVNTSRVKGAFNELMERGEIGDEELKLFGAYVRRAARIK